jgi:hypothetical protein
MGRHGSERTSRFIFQTSAKGRVHSIKTHLFPLQIQKWTRKLGPDRSSTTTGSASCHPVHQTRGSCWRGKFCMGTIVPHRWSTTSQNGQRFSKLRLIEDQSSNLEYRCLGVHVMPWSLMPHCMAGIDGHRTGTDQQVQNLFASSRRGGPTRFIPKDSLSYGF